MTAVQLRPQDCLSACFVDLLAVARTLWPWEGEARQSWTDASRDLLYAVPDPVQRLAWAVQLASAFAHTMPGVPLYLMVGMLLGRD